VRPADKLDEACTNADNWMMLVQHRSSDCVMSKRGFGRIFSKQRELTDCRQESGRQEGEQ